MIISTGKKVSQGPGHEELLGQEGLCVKSKDLILIPTQVLNAKGTDGTLIANAIAIVSLDDGK